MFSLISKLQKKPESQKRKIVLALSTTITGIIFIIWLSVMRFEFSGQNVADENSVSPLDTLKANAIDSFSGLSEGIKDITSEIKEVRNAVENASTTEQVEMATSSEDL